MKIPKIQIFFACLLLFFIGSLDAGAGQNSIATKLEKDVVSYRLPNGMKWLLLRRANAPVFAGIVHVKVGGLEEEVGKTGLAHMIEHMAFKGTKDISSDELWDAFSTNGAGNLNAYTNKDVTAYHAKMPSSKLELWIYLTSEMVQHSVLRDFYKERDVVTEELMSSIENNPSGKMYSALLDAAFKKSPYRWPTIGKKEDVTKLKVEYLADFKKKYYSPNRMTGAIVGDIDIEKTKLLLNKYFGVMPATKPIVESFPNEEIQTEPVFSKVSFEANPRLLMAFHKPTLPSHDDYVFDVLTYMMCDGDNSRLKKTLIFEKKLVRAIGCDSSVPGTRLDNLFVIVAEPMKGHSYEEVRSAIEFELNKLKTETPTDSELTRAKNNVEKDFVFQLGDNEGIAEDLSYYETVAGDWRYVTRHGNIVSKIEGSDIQKLAQKYFDDENKTVVELVKENL